jgi:hypothetical protein
MATIDECREAIREVAARLAANPEAGSRIALNRSFGCYIRDLNVHFRGRLGDGRITNLTDGEDPNAQIRLAVTGDDLLALVDGRLHFASAWASGRLSVRASLGDLLKLRKLA